MSVDCHVSAGVSWVHENKMCCANVTNLTGVKMIRKKCNQSLCFRFHSVFLKLMWSYAKNVWDYSANLLSGVDCHKANWGHFLCVIISFAHANQKWWQFSPSLEDRLNLFRVEMLPNIELSEIFMRKANRILFFIINTWDKFAEVNDFVTMLDVRCYCITIHLQCSWIF